eukprot:gene2023-2300_t
MGLLQGRDTFIAQPTGSGKSAVYVLFPFCVDIYNILLDEMLTKIEQEKSITHVLKTRSTSSAVLVIQPLISLMKDQIRAIQENKIKVSRLTQNDKVSASSHEHEEPTVILASPEAVLRQHRHLMRSDKVGGRIVCVAVDEGHCITKWGTNSKKSLAMREDYSKLVELRSLVGRCRKVPFACLTATALPSVEKAIITNLQMQSVLRVVIVPDRPNIRYTVLEFKDQDDVLQFLSFSVQDIKEHGFNATRILIFCRNHNHCRTLFRLYDRKFDGKYQDFLTRPYAMFHAGTHPDVKHHIIESMSKPNGYVRIVFATTAFGMGVDCKSLQHVIHFGPPNDIDDYIQESGRAGRDGLQSHAILLLHPRCMTSKTSPAMKAYSTNTMFCRRNSLVKYFGKGISDLGLECHQCCDVCAQQCQCNTCKEFGINFRSPLEVNYDLHSKISRQASTPAAMSAEGRDSLKVSLLQLRNSVLSNCSSVVVGVNISTGFPVCVVDEVVANADTFINKESVWLQTSLLDIELAGQIFEILSDIRSKYRNENPEIKPNLDSTCNVASDSSEEFSLTESEMSSSDVDSGDSDAVCARRYKYRACFSDERFNDSDEDFSD